MPFVFNPPPCPPKCAVKPTSEYDAFITRGTTPTFSFTLPEELTESTINDLCLAFNQDNTVVFTKKLVDCSFSENTLITTLSQENTLALVDGICYFQLKIKDTSGNVVASQIYKALVQKILCDEVL